VAVELSPLTYGGLAVVGAVLLTVLIQSRVKTHTPRFRILSADQAQEFYSHAADAEVGARKAAAGKFRGRPWSQDDEFHSREAKFVRDYSKSHRIPVASLLETLDRGMHEKWPTPGMPPDPTIVPCRPRLTY